MPKKQAMPVIPLHPAAAGADPLTLDALLQAVRGCSACAAHLPLGPRPVLQVGAGAGILIVGQAPGLRVHNSGIPWDDASGKRLREWMGVEPAVFYDAARVAIIPMAYCYPGRGASGDLPPRRECAQLWPDRLLAHLPHIRLTLLVGQYAQQHFLGERRRTTLTDTVMAWRDYAPDIVPLPHPSPRNQPWFSRHPWFGAEVLPALRSRVAAALSGASR
jgi:uracil-DNA glycosylase